MNPIPISPARAWPGRMPAALLAASWLLIGGGLQAQTLYEWRDTAGTLVYSQLPPGPAARGPVRVLVLPELPAPQRAAAARMLVQSGPPAQDAGRLEQADARVQRAIDALQQAERALQQRQEPEPGERQGLASGHSRLTGAYYERLAGLQGEVDRRRAELQAAYAARDALVP
jgi:hypothetical protein